MADAQVLGDAAQRPASLAEAGGHLAAVGQRQALLRLGAADGHGLGCSRLVPPATARSASVRPVESSQARYQGNSAAVWRWAGVRGCWSLTG
jgi:hypothetical protein